MAPLVHRTWAPRGQTPLLTQKGSSREKVSVASGLWISPERDRLGLFSWTLVNEYFDNVCSAAFIEALLKELDQRVIVLWDGGTMHQGDPIRELTRRFAGQLCLEPLTAYAPMLNPVEYVWSWLKNSRLNNFAPTRCQAAQPARGKGVGGHPQGSAIVGELCPCRRASTSTTGFGVLMRLLTLLF